MLNIYIQMLLGEIMRKTREAGGIDNGTKTEFSHEQLHE